MAKRTPPPAGKFGFNSSRRTTNVRHRIHVTQEDIAFALRLNSGHCMNAEAIKRDIPNATHVTVDLQTIRWSNPIERLRYMALTPRKVQAALINWDNALVPKPYDFTITHAQVTNMRNSKFGEPERTETKTKLSKRKTKRISAKDLPKSATLVVAKKRGHHYVQTLGGKLPPRMGLRRTFGIRAFSLGEDTQPIEAFGKLDLEQKE